MLSDSYYSRPVCPRVLVPYLWGIASGEMDEPCKDPVADLKRVQCGLGLGLGLEAQVTGPRWGEGQSHSELGLGLGLGLG